MGRFLLGLGILLVFLALGLWIGCVMDTTHTQIADTLEQAAALALTDNPREGEVLAQQAYQQWQSRWQCIAAVADHAPMDEIDSLFAQLQIYGQEDQWTDFAAFCTRLSQLVSAMGEAHRFTWWNLL